MKRLLTHAALRTPRILIQERATTAVMAIAFCARESSGTKVANAEAKATPSAAIEPELPKVKFANPEINATRSP